MFFVTRKRPSNRSGALAQNAAANEGVSPPFLNDYKKGIPFHLLGRRWNGFFIHCT